MKNKRTGKGIRVLLPLMVAVSLLAAACSSPQGATPATATIETEHLEADSPHMGLVIDYPQVSGLADSAAEKKINDLMAERGQATIDFAAEEDERYEDPSGRPYQVELDYRVTHNGDGVLSVILEEYSYLGGAHGGLTRYSYTFDLATGDILTLGDLLGATPDYLQQASAEIEAQIVEQDIPLIADFEGITDDQAFYLADDQVVVYFQQYEYTPYAAGLPEFALSLPVQLP